MEINNEQFKGAAWTLIIGGFLLFDGFRRKKLHQKILAIPTSKIRSMAMGTIELSGHAYTYENLMDPIYGRPCAFYNIEIQEYRRSKRSSHWATIHTDNSHGKPFYLEDNTGRILVFPDNPDLHFPKQELARTGMFSSKKNVAAMAYIERNKGTFNWGTKRVMATIIRETETLYLLGYAQSLPRELQQEVKIPARDAAHLLKNDKEAMKKLDTNNDGQVDQFEWDLGLQKYKKEIEKIKTMEKKEKLEAHPVPTSNACVVSHNAQKLIFAPSEKQLLSRTGRWYALEILGGVILVCIGLVFSLNIFGFA